QRHVLISWRSHPHPCPSPQGGGVRWSAVENAPSSWCLRSLAFAGASGSGLLGSALLGLLAGHRLLRVVAGGTLQEAGGVEEAQDAVGRLGALGEPGLDLLVVENDAGGIVLGLHRVVGADLLDEAAVARGARIGNDDAVIGTLLRTTTGETDLQGHGILLLVSCDQTFVSV